MADYAQRSHLICYDIADPRRLGRMHRYLKKHAMAVQYSVFLLECTPARLRQVTQEIQGLLDERADDVRIYTLPSRVKTNTLGNQALTDGIRLLGNQQVSYVSGL